MILSRAGRKQKFVDFVSDLKHFKYKKQQTQTSSVIQMELNPLLEHYVNSITMWGGVAKIMRIAYLNTCMNYVRCQGNESSMVTGYLWYNDW